MITFTYYATLAFLIGLVGLSGLVHLTRLVHFTGVLQSHQLIPLSLTRLTAGAVTLFEWAVGLAALGLILYRPLPMVALLLYGACLGAAVVFILYLQRLLQTRPQGVITCGCTALSGPLSPATKIPALGLGVAAASGMLTVGALQLNPALGQTRTAEVLWLALGWGLLLAVCVTLFPATVPGVLEQRRTQHA